ncbi:MAG: hypothetical protein DMF74_08820 [Acidobacteria bacterium]|nr:MAG: hypothetical protein DMF74_08820 [Acidobacteriota bacterium]
MQHLYHFAKSFLGLACLVLILGTGAAFAQTRTADGIGLFGDGSDLDVTITKSTFLPRDMYYNNLTIESGQTLHPNGFRVFVSGTLTLNKGARISRDGNDAPGAALSAGTLGGSGAGGNWLQYSTQPVANSLGGSGGGVDRGYGGVASPPDASAGGGGVFRSALQALSGRSLDGALVNGGAGGIYGGSGGGVVVVAARAVVVNGDATISANGGQSVGGCGGGGGVVVVITTTAQPAGLKLSASGGDGSADFPDSKGADGFTAWLN